MLLLLTAGAILWWVSIRPSNHRRWAKDQVLLPQVIIHRQQVAIKNIRNFAYRSENDFTPGYYDKTFDVQQLQHVYFIFTPFTRSRHAAHAFLSFEFGHAGCVAISVEIRKKHQERYSAIKGLLKQYELMYVIADEADVIGLRATYRRNDVFMYPLRLTHALRQALFLGMVTRAGQLAQRPEFYNTIRNACVTNLAAHFNAVWPGSVPFNLRLILSGYADRYWHALGLFDTHLSFEQAKRSFYISERARRARPGENFSQAIRRQAIDHLVLY